MPEEKTYDDHDKLVRILTLMEGSQENFKRLENEIKEVRKDATANLALIAKRVDDIEAKLDRQQGGLGFGKWMIGVIGSLPFLGGVLGWWASQRV